MGEIVNGLCSGHKTARFGIPSGKTLVSTFLVTFVSIQYPFSANAVSGRNTRFKQAGMKIALQNDEFINLYYYGKETSDPE